MKFPSVTRGYEMVAHPDGPLVVDDMQNVFTPGALPPPDILCVRAGDHVRETTGAAPQALGLVVSLLVPAHPAIVCVLCPSVKGNSSASMPPCPPANLFLH